MNIKGNLNHESYAPYAIATAVTNEHLTSWIEAIQLDAYF